MNASTHAFRSHLLQQFAAAARSQSKPPLALIGWIAEEDQTQQPSSSTEGVASGTLSNSRRITQIGSTVLSSQGVNLPRELSRHHSRNNDSWKNIPRRHLSSLPLSDSSVGGGEQDLTGFDSSSVHVELPTLFQNLLQTRRSNNRFAPATSTSWPVGTDDHHHQYWEDVLERAVQCGIAAPNHKRTEPFTFIRMIAPSTKTRQLADIAYYVSLRKQQQQQEGDSNSLRTTTLASSSSSLLTKSEDQADAQAAAERKREKWNQVPAFLVSVVSSHDTTVVDPAALPTTDPYDPLAYVPPSTERDLEDYATACAAVQNVLLSLHAEQVASKWVTGTVVRTPAFRELIQAQPEDRVVALIMVGRPDEKHPPKAYRRRRPLKGNVLVDL